MATIRQSNSGVLAAMKQTGAPLNRDEFLLCLYMGDVPEVIPAEDECEFPEQFQFSTLIDEPMLTDRIQ